MEKASEEVTGGIPGTRQTNLKKAFKLGIFPLLTSCSREEFCKAFANFTPAEQDRLHRLFIQVITSLHESIEDEFESLCLETQAGATLDMVEQLVEEQSLDPLFPEKSNFEEAVHCLSEAKKNELSYLTALLEKAEERKRAMTSRLEVLKEGKVDFSGAADIVNKIKMGNQKYGTANSIGLP